MELVKEINFGVDIKELQHFTLQYLNHDFAIRMNGFSLQHRKAVVDPWNFVDGLESGKLYQNFSEKVFSTINEKFINTEFERIINHFSLFRTRIMNMIGKTCYSLHQDMTWRLHIPIITNDNCFFYFPKHKQDFFLEEGKVYLVNTTETHTFVNSSIDRRIHLVGCIDNKDYLC